MLINSSHFPPVCTKKEAKDPQSGRLPVKGW